MTETNIKVIVKVRPLIKRERDNKQAVLWRINENSIHLIEQATEKFNFGM